MEVLRRPDGSEGGFSFPSTPVQDRDSEIEFEFGSATPGSPSTDMSKNSPADHLFFNGKLLPHSFPSQKANSILLGNFPRAASRASSVSSRDSSYSSLMSSRSNSTNSRSSSSSSSTSSARTSYSSDHTPEIRRLLHQSKLSSIKARSVRERYKPPSNKDVVAQLYGSQRWQFITPVPGLSRETSARRKKLPEQVIKEEKQLKEEKKRSFCRRFIDSFASTCRQCHAMETRDCEET